MIALAVVSIALRLIVVALACVLITRLHDILNWRERTGAGIFGGAGFLTIGVIADVNKEGTPFDTVAGLVMSIGLALFLWGFLDRKLGHERRNRQQKEAAEQHFRSKA